MEKLINNFKISFTKGDTYALAVKFKNIAEDLRNAYFTVKENPDDEPLIQKSLGAGIDKIDDREYKNEKTYKIQLQAEDTANIEPLVQYLYDLQVTIDNVVKTVLSGVFVVTHSVTGVTSTTTQTLDVAVDDEVETEILTTPATNGIEYEQDPIACAKIGDITALSTQYKEKLVGAINEVNNIAKTSAQGVSEIVNGTTIVPKAQHASSADHASTAGHASSADHALTTEKDNGGNIIHETYAKKDSVGKAYLVTGANITKHLYFQMLFLCDEELETEDISGFMTAYQKVKTAIAPSNTANGSGYPCNGTFEGVYPITSIYMPSSTKFGFVVARTPNDGYKSYTVEISTDSLNCEVKRLF